MLEVYIYTIWTKIELIEILGCLIVSVPQNRTSDVCFYWSWMDGVAWSGHNCVEAVVVVRSVVDGTNGTIRFHQRILSLNHITITMFHLRFMVASMSISYTILVIVSWISLLGRRRKNLVCFIFQAVFDHQLDDF